jgi:hypothetical protein
MTRLQFVQEMIVSLRSFMLTSSPVISLTDDSGQSISYDRKGAWDMLKELEREEKMIMNPTGYRKHIDLRNAFE